MLARTERNLGFAAALILTAAAFIMPEVPTQIAQNDSIHEKQIQLASAVNLRSELRHFINLAVTTPEGSHRN